MQLEPEENILPDEAGQKERYCVKALLQSGDVLLSHFRGFVVKYHTAPSAG